MSNELNRYYIKPVEGREVPIWVILECEKRDGFPNYGAADTFRQEIIGRYKLEAGALEVDVRR